MAETSESLLLRPCASTPTAEIIAPKTDRLSQTLPLQIPASASILTCECSWNERNLLHKGRAHSLEGGDLLSGNTSMILVMR
jgi:hypothetical protein